MEFNRIQNAIDLLGQAPPPPPPREVPQLPSNRQPDGQSEPKLAIAWGDFHQGTLSSIVALFGPSAVKGFLHATAFRDSWVEGRIPKRAVIAAALWHAAFLAMPFSILTGMAHRNPALQNVELTWSGPIEDLPLLEIARVKPKALTRAKPEAPAPRGADAYHPRQRIFTDPVRPTHPRQTLINPKAPFEPPKLLPNLPNIVQFQKLPGPAYRTARRGHESSHRTVRTRAAQTRIECWSGATCCAESAAWRRRTRTGSWCDAVNLCQRRSDRLDRTLLESCTACSSATASRQSRCASFHFP